MTDRVHGIVVDEVERVAARPGDLGAVRERARQRQQRRRGTIAAVAATLVLGALLTGLTMDRSPEAPFVGDQATETAFLLHWCPEQVCGEPEVPAEEAVAQLDAEPWVRSAELMDEAEQWERMVEQLGRDRMGDVSPDALAPIVEVVVEPDGPLLDAAVELSSAAPGAGVSLGRLAESAAELAPVASDERFDPDAALGGRERVVADDDRGLDVWRVEDGGVCLGLGDLVSCHRNQLLTGTDVTAHEDGAWGTLDDGSSCTWGRTGLESEQVVVTYDDGTEVEAELGLAPDVVLGQVFLACSRTGGYPVELETSSPTGGSSASADDGTSVVQRRGQ